VNKNGLNTKQTGFLIEKITTGVFTVTKTVVHCHDLGCVQCDLFDVADCGCALIGAATIQETFIAEHFPEVLL